MKIPKRTLVQLAQVFDGGKHSVGGWLVSEKLDGQRCLWDGGITRGVPIRSVPWANVEKQDRFINQDVNSTGLWTRYGHPIAAPTSWLDNLPAFPLDGELYLGRNRFQDLMSITRRLEPNASDWDGIKYHIYEAPAYSEIFDVGEINEPHYRKIISPDSLLSLGVDLPKTIPRPFGAKLTFLDMCLPSDRANLVLHPQERLPYERAAYTLKLSTMLATIIEAGGEGLMLRCPNSFWVPKRVPSLLKVKQVQDAEAVVVGYRAAEVGKLHGLMGALTVRYGSIVFDLSGFTDSEREWGDGAATAFALSSPGAVMPSNFVNLQFPRGSSVTFKYRELTDDGVPKEARYFRKA